MSAPGFSRRNPRGLRKDCVFVTTAYLANISVEELAKVTGHEKELHVDRGMTITQTHAMLSAYCSHIHGANATLPAKKSTRSHRPTPTTLRSLITAHGPVGIGYNRKDPRRRSWHALVVKMCASDSKHPDGLIYLCYQTDPIHGVDMTSVASSRDARIVFWFVGTGWDSMVPERREDAFLLLDV